MAALPRHSSLFIKSIDKGRPKAFYESLLQVNGKSKIKVINLDSATMMEEVASAERSELFKDPEKYVETPIESSKIVSPYDFRIGGFEVASNCDNSVRASNGAINRMFSQTDLHQLRRTLDEVEANAKEISDIDLTSTLR